MSSSKRPAERLSARDDTMLGGYADSIQRHEFALHQGNGIGRRVLDSGCGTGYGADYFACHGARSVVGMDISQEAIDEANELYRRDNLRFERRDIQTLGDDAALHWQFDLVVNLSNVAHLPQPERFIGSVLLLLSDGGRLVISTPNAGAWALDRHGRPSCPYHFHAYDVASFTALLAPRFKRITMYGNWLSHAGKLRQIRTYETFELLCEAYYNPAARFTRAVKKAMRRKTMAPPVYRGASDSYPGDYVLGPIDGNAPPWPPVDLIAVCEK